jgi:hypothetical protein
VRTLFRTNGTTICSLLTSFSIVIVVYVNGCRRVRNHRFVKRWAAKTAAMVLSHKQCFHFSSIGCADTSLLFSFRRSPHLHWWVWAYHACNIGPFAAVSSPLIRLKDDATNGPYTSIVSAYPCHRGRFCQLDHCGDLCLCYSVALRASYCWSILAPVASNLIQIGH